MLEAKTINSVLYTAVPNSEREAFLMKHYGDLFQIYENAVFSLADHLIKDYSGGFWEFCESSDQNTIPFLYYTEENIEINNVFLDNPVVLPGVLAGLSVSAQAIIWMLQRHSSKIDDTAHDILTDRYHALIELGYKIADQLDVSDTFFEHVD